jgi:hypothetical protein
VYPRLTFLVRDAFLSFRTTKEDYLEELLRGPPASAGTLADDDDDDRLAQAQQESRTVSRFAPCLPVLDSIFKLPFHWHHDAGMHETYVSGSNTAAFP